MKTSAFTRTCSPLHLGMEHCTAMPALPNFHVDVQQRGRLRVVAVDGELDVFTAPQLGAAVDDEEAFDDLVIDLARVPFMSSVGLGLLSSVNRRQTRRGRGLALAAVRDDVERLLEITGLTEALLIADTVPAAIDLLRGHGGYYAQ
jgi:anti-anti-sigma factor